MQLMFELETSPLLPRLRKQLLDVFGPQKRTARPEPLSQLIHSLLSARTLDAVSGEAFVRLREAFKDWSELIEAAPKKIEAAIAETTFADRKARQLPILARVIQVRTGGLDLDFLGDRPVEEAMAWLQSLPGVGIKSAAATLNFSRLNGRALVVDTHVHRGAKRLGMVGRASEPAQAYETLMTLVPQAWNAADLYELHWLLKGLGQSICGESAPRCGMCPLKAICPRVGVGVGRKVVELAAARGVRA
ncbi:MAG TPA: endonuclease III [Caulobacteraceae bacterium]|jgi:endonuclease-3|nr:endonuclease III [Caulobacteraceae bacterium]